MIPGVNGFGWSMGHAIFLGAFYAVVLVVLMTVSRALVRARRALRIGRAEAIRWKTEFADLPPLGRRCRHELNGELESQICQNGFDCRSCAIHATFAGTAAATPSSTPSDPFGFPLPLDRLYDRGHTWVHEMEDGTLAVGPDELARRLVGNPERLSLPAPGARVRLHGAAWSAGRNGTTVRTLSPIDGTVIATGGPQQDWFLRLRPDMPKPDTRHLLRGSEVVRWTSRELDRLHELAAPGLCQTMADGGTLVEDLGAALPKDDWGRICGAMLLEP